MIYPLMVLDDETEIAHSDIMLDDNGKEYVRVCLEKPVEGGFESAECTIPGYEWKSVNGFNKFQLDQYLEIIKNMSHIIIQLARDGGFENASSF